MQPVFESIESQTVEEFARFVETRAALDDGYRYELLNGRIVMTPPAGWPHGGIEVRLGAALFAVAGEGRVTGSSQGYILPAGHVVEPDVAYISPERWAACEPEDGAFLPVVPDLVIEILSPKTRSRDRGEKRGLYERAGVREYWLVDPRERQVTVLVAGDDGRYTAEHLFEAGQRASSTVLPALSIDLDELYA